MPGSGSLSLIWSIVTAASARRWGLIEHQEYEVCAAAAAAHISAAGADIDDRWSLFVQTSTTDDLAVLLAHVGDFPPTDTAEQP